MKHQLAVLSIVILLAASSVAANVPSENLRCGSLQWFCGKGPHIVYTVPADSVFVLTDFAFFAAPEGPCQYQVGNFFIMNRVGGTPLWSEVFHWNLDPSCQISDDAHFDQHWRHGLVFRSGQSLVALIEEPSLDFGCWRGGWAGYVAPATQTSSTELGTLIPTHNELMVQPNPGSNSVTIQFALERTSAGSLAIYDAQGRAVRTIAQGTMKQGQHSLVWDGRNDRGSQVPNGIYFARLDVGGSPAAGKIDYLR